MPAAEGEEEEEWAWPAALMSHTQAHTHTCSRAHTFKGEDTGRKG